MGDILKIITDSGFSGYVIVTLGIFGLAIVFERVKTLYFDYALKSDTFMEQVKNLVLLSEFGGAAKEEAATPLSPQRTASEAMTWRGRASAAVGLIC
jgi:hypothetical protein